MKEKQIRTEIEGKLKKLRDTPFTADDAGQILKNGEKEISTCSSVT